MARVRFIGPEPVTVPELGNRVIEPDEIVEVPDDRFDAYVCQPLTWDPIEEPRPADEVQAPALPAAPLKKSAAKPQKEG